MTKTILEQGGQKIALLHSDTVLINNASAAMDLIATTFYEDNCTAVFLNKEAMTDDFFILSSGLAGDILQKFANYRMQLAIIGDFGCYTSKPLQDFMYESNKGRHICFAASQQAAMDWLAKN